MMGSLDLLWAAEGQKSSLVKVMHTLVLPVKAPGTQELQGEDCSHGISFVNENTLHRALGICACRRLKG